MTDKKSAIENTVRVGDRIETSDGHELGKVKEVTLTHFKVDASMRTDYWLPRAEVATVDGECVRMDWPNSEFDKKPLPGPDVDETVDVSEFDPEDRLAERDLNEAARASMYRSRFGV